MSPTTACCVSQSIQLRAERNKCRRQTQLSARINGSGVSSVGNMRSPRRQRETVYQHPPQRTPVTSPGSANRRSRRGVQGLPAVPRASHGWPLLRLPLLLLLLLLLLLQVAGLQSTAVAYADTEKEEGSKASRLHARDRDRTPPSSRRLADLPDVTIGANNSGGDVVGAENKGGDQEEAPSSLDEEATEAGTAAGADEGGGAGGEPLTPEESAKALLADGGPRCFFDGGDVKEPSGEEGGSEQRRLLCLPTLFLLGVSKCGTSSLSEWMSHHPRIRWVRRPQHLYYREAHVFDIPPDAAEWRRSATSPSSLLRDRLAVEAREGDIVVDYTPNYSLVAEIPYRISDVYGQGPLVERGLKFLVVLREPAARTISSWEYKTDPDLADRVAKARYPELLLASVAGRAVEVRPLKQAVEEGMEMVTRLAECVANATAAEDEGGYGRGGHEVTLCDGDSSTVPEEDCEDGSGVERLGGAACDGDQRDQGRGAGCEESACESYVEPWCNPADFLEDNLYDAHVGKSAYALQLARWFAVFGRDKFKVIFTEDMAEDPMGTLEDIFGFLGLDLLDPDELQGLRSLEEWEGIVRHRSNEADPAKHARLAPQVTPEIVESLRDFFAPHNAALEDLLEVQVPAGWRTRRR